MSKVSPKKLLYSKWTALNPSNKEKHFMIVDVEFDEDSNVVSCVIEAVMTKSQRQINWRDLKNSELWRAGWR